MLQDPLADALSAIKNAERIGQHGCIVKANKVIKAVLKIMQEHGFIGAYEFIDDGKSGKLKIELNGKIIDCNVIKPRFAVKTGEFEKWEKRYLPAREFGLLIISTPKGMVDHKKAKQMQIGGRLVAFAY